VCEYEVNPVERKKKKNNVKCQGHNVTGLWQDLDLSNNVYEYKVNRLTNESYLKKMKL